MATEIAERITVDPVVMVGKPVVKGTRVPVEDRVRDLYEKRQRKAARGEHGGTGGAAPPAEGAP